MSIFGKHLIILFLITAITVSFPVAVHSEIGKTVKDFKNSYFYKKFGLKLEENIPAIFNADTKAYFFKNDTLRYSVKTITDDQGRIVGHSLSFDRTDNREQATKDVIAILVFILEAIGNKASNEELISRVKNMLREATNNKNLVSSKSLNGFSIEIRFQPKHAKWEVLVK